MLHFTRVYTFLFICLSGWMNSHSAVAADQEASPRCLLLIAGVGIANPIRVKESESTFMLDINNGISLSDIPIGLLEMLGGLRDQLVDSLKGIVSIRDSRPGSSLPAEYNVNIMNPDILLSGSSLNVKMTDINRELFRWSSTQGNQYEQLRNLVGRLVVADTLSSRTKEEAVAIAELLKPLPSGFEGFDAKFRRPVLDSLRDMFVRLSSEIVSLDKVMLGGDIQHFGDPVNIYALTKTNVYQLPHAKRSIVLELVLKLYVAKLTKLRVATDQFIKQMTPSDPFLAEKARREYIEMEKKGFGSFNHGQDFYNFSSELKKLAAPLSFIPGVKLEDLDEPTE